ncbi:MAG: dsDNA nuclease domain-containing protein [Pirellulales bacterium]
MTVPYPVLDAAQLVRIQSTHRGYLYQHLYGAGCLLSASAASATSIIIEHDEDVEIILSNAHAYVQVKTRKDPLVFSDIKEALDRFDTLRSAHASGARALTPKFFVVSNSAPGPDLEKLYRGADWKPDVRLIWPGEHPEATPYLPPAWSTIEEGVQWCARIADTLPHAKLPGDALTWKLCAIVQHAATGTAPSGHSFQVSDLPTIFDQVVVQLQSLPNAPVPYIPHGKEPDFNSPDRVQLVVGHSGIGKTAWAAEAATHSDRNIAYFDVSDIPGPACRLPRARARRAGVR